MAVYSYMRVSTTKQQTLRQEYVLDKQGIKVDKAFVDKITGVVKDRHELNKLKLIVKEGDIIYGESISRFGRDLKDTIEICDYFVKKGVQVRILKEGIDSSSATYKVMLAVGAAIADMERETIQERVIQSVESLKQIKEETGEIKTKTGKWFGREELTKEALLKKHPKFGKYLERTKLKAEDGGLSKSEMAKLLGVSRATLYRYIDIYNNGI